MIHCGATVSGDVPKRVDVIIGRRMRNSLPGMVIVASSFHC
jgi:hypothetical protein